MREPMSEPTVIVSDIHLGGVPNAVEDAFIGFLREWPVPARTLLINGDLFDFWFEYRTVIPGAHFHVLRALADLHDAGVRMVLVGGNHDAWGGAFLRDEVGIEPVEGPLELNLSNRRTLVAHGDGLAHGDVGYKMLRRFLRSGAARGLMRALHPDLADRIVQRVSHTGEHDTRALRKGVERSRALSEYGTRLLQERPELDLVVFGHCHIPELREIEPGRYYINSGDWVDHRTYTVVSADGVAQRDWAG